MNIKPQLAEMRKILQTEIKCQRTAMTKLTKQEAKMSDDEEISAAMKNDLKKLGHSCNIVKETQQDFNELLLSIPEAILDSDNDDTTDFVIPPVKNFSSVNIIAAPLVMLQRRMKLPQNKWKLEPMDPELQKSRPQPILDGQQTFNYDQVKELLKYNNTFLLPGVLLTPRPGEVYIMKASARGIMDIDIYLWMNLAKNQQAHPDSHVLPKREYCARLTREPGVGKNYTKKGRRYAYFDT